MWHHRRHHRWGSRHSSDQTNLANKVVKVRRRIELTQIIVDGTDPPLTGPFEWNLSMDPQNDVYAIYAEYKIPSITWHVRDVAHNPISQDLYLQGTSYVPLQTQHGRIVTYYNGTTTVPESGYQQAINIANAEIHFDGIVSRRYSPCIWLEDDDGNFIAKRDQWIPTDQPAVTQHGLFYFFEPPQTWVNGAASPSGRTYYNYIEVEVELRGLLWSND